MSKLKICGMFVRKYYAIIQLKIGHFLFFENTLKKF